MKRWLLVLAAIASSVCTLLSTAPVGSGIAALGAPFLLILIALYACSMRSALVIVFLAQLPLWLWLHRWVDAISTVGWLGLGLYMSIWAPLFVYMLRRIQLSKAFQIVSIVFVSPVFWVGLECLRGLVLFDGYPWYLVGTGIVDTMFVQIASYGSVWLASFLVVMFAAALATLKSVKPQTWFMFFGLWLLLALFTEVSTPSVDTVNKNLAVAIVQTNVPQDNKIAWTWDRQQKDVANAIELTYEAVKHATEKPELVVWPETMLPGVGLEVDRFDFAPWEHALTPYWQWGEKIRKLASEINIPILVGSQTWIDVKVESDGEKLNIIPSSKFNSAVLVFPDGRTNRYDKTFLTPFGERIPYFEHLEWLNRKVRELVGATMLFDLDQGDMPNYLTIPELENEGSIRIGTPICFEDTVPSVVRNLVWEDGDRRVGVLINLSNDGWFGDADDARLQHIREARMRCIENRTPMIRVANTGMSCLINATGQVSQYAMSEGNRAIRKTAFGLFTTPQGFVRPLSARIGDGVAWICLFASILFISISGLKRSSIHAEKD